MINMMTTTYERPWSLVDELLGIQNDLNRVFGSPMRRGSLRSATRYPLVNVWESSEGLVVDAELPGVDPKQVDIAVEDGVLVISGRRDALPAEEQDRYQRRERPEGEFARSLELPFRVEADAVKAVYRHGILRVTLPRAEADKPKRIAVKVA